MISRIHRLIVYILFSLWLFATAAVSAGQPSSGSSGQAFAADTVLVKFKAGTDAQGKARAHASAMGQLKKVLRGIDVEVVSVRPGTVQSAIKDYRKNPGVEYAEPNYRRQLYLPATVEGTEPDVWPGNNFEEQWGLNNTGQTFGATIVTDPLLGIPSIIYPSYQGTAGADINAPEAWGSDNHGSAGIAIAVLDSGVACDHLDLFGKCVEQVNFVTEHASPDNDVFGHGTHVAGIAAALTNNGLGIAGVGWDTSIGSLKVCYEEDIVPGFGVYVAVCEDADVAEAITHVINSTSVNYKVINMSLAGAESSQTLQAAVDAAWNAGLVLVAGAGNGYTADVMYPAGYSHVIAVASSDFHDNLSVFSTFGQWVSVMAPGTHILSTVPGEFCGQPAADQSSCYDAKSGTSMSTPHVSGLAALLWAHQDTPTNISVRAAIENSADATGALGQNMQAWVQHGRINMAAALENDTDPPPPPVAPVTHHVQSVLVDTVNAGKGNKRGRAIVNVVDNLGGSVEEASVTGTFSGSYQEQVTVSTNSAGAAILTTSQTARGGVSFTFCVDDIVHSDTDYEQNDNVVTCAGL